MGTKGELWGILSTPLGVLYDPPRNPWLVLLGSLDSPLEISEDSHGDAEGSPIPVDLDWKKHFLLKNETFRKRFEQKTKIPFHLTLLKKAKSAQISVRLGWTKKDFTSLKSLSIKLGLKRSKICSNYRLTRLKEAKSTQILLRLG